MRKNNKFEKEKSKKWKKISKKDREWQLMMIFMKKNQDHNNNMFQ